MATTNSKFFSVMVVGEEPKSLMEKYDMGKEVEPYVKYKYLDAEKYKTSAIKILDKLLTDYDKVGMPITAKEALENRLKSLKTMSTFEYYKELTDGMYYDENGNALSSENKDGHWVTCRIGRNFALPLILKNGEESYSAYNKDINWEAMHQNHKEIYKAAWEMVMEDREPITDEEKTIYNSMKDKDMYFSKFKNKDAYVSYSTSYWNYAYVDKNGWVDVDGSKEGEEAWIESFYEKFVKPLKDDDLVTIFECTINNG